MDKIKNAAIILLGIGEKAAAEILKSMNPKEVSAILEAINGIDNVTEEDVIRALNDFFMESNNSAGIDSVTKEQIKNSLMTAMGSKGIHSLMHGIKHSKEDWIATIKSIPMSSIVDMIQGEHPQIITAIVIVVFNNVSSESGTQLIKAMSPEMQIQVFRRMTGIGYISKIAIDIIAEFFSSELSTSERNDVVTLDGIETVANIVSYLDSETEHRIMTDLTADNKELGEKIQDKIFPFYRLAELDKKSVQVLLNEVKSEDLVVALKGVDDHVKEIFMQNMSVKAAEILRDDMEMKGPVKIANVMDAQKKIIRLAKKLDQEEKIILSSKGTVL